MTDGAVTTIVAGVIQIAVIISGVVMLWIRQKYGEEKTDKLARQADTVEKKLDQNTVLTTAGAKVATAKAQEAATAAKNVEKKLNGGIDAAIQEGLAPIKAALEEHAASDEKNMLGIDRKFTDLTEYVHKRNHDVLDVLSGLSNKINVLVQKATEKTP